MGGVLEKSSGVFRTNYALTRGYLTARTIQMRKLEAHKKATMPAEGPNKFRPAFPADEVFRYPKPPNVPPLRASISAKLNFYNQNRATLSESPYAQKMKRLSARIFGEVAFPTSEQSMKIVRKYSIEPSYKQWLFSPEYYPRHVEMYNLMRRLRDLGLYRDEHVDFNEEMIRLRALRGKVKPKKGQGKKAMLKKAAG